MAHPAALVVSILFVTLLLMTSAEGGVSPGLKLRISQKGMDYAAGVAVEILTGDLQGKSIPDQHGSDHLSVGKVKYDITQMHLVSFGKPSSNVKVNAGHGITWTLAGASAKVNGRWHYEYKWGFIKIRDSGSFDVSVSGASLTVSVTLGKDAAGRPTISSTGCSCDPGSVSVKFHGGASWLYNLFSHQVEKPLKSALQKMLCDAATKAINVNAEKSLSRMKVNVKIAKILDLDYSLVAPPVFGPAYVETLHKGEVFWLGDKTESALKPQPMPEGHCAQNMLAIGVSDYILNTLGEVLQKHSLLLYYFTQKDLSGKDKSLLNITCSGTCIGGFVPQLKKKFPDGVVELKMASDKAPILDLQPNNMNGNFAGQIKFMVHLSNGSVVYAFTTQATMQVNLTGEISEFKIKGKITDSRINIKVTDSAIGNVPDTALNFAVQFLSKLFIVPKLNEIGEKGLDLPSIDHVAFVNPRLDLVTGSLFLCTDVKYADTTLYFTPA